MRNAKNALRWWLTISLFLATTSFFVWMFTSGGEAGAEAVSACDGVMTEIEAVGLPAPDPTSRLWGAELDKRRAQWTVILATVIDNSECFSTKVVANSKVGLAQLMR